MRPTQTELLLVGLVILYIAFATHPAPSHIQDFLSTPVGHIVALLGILYVTVYQSLLVGVFLGIAYIMTAQQVTEYMDPKEQTPKKEEETKPQPTATMVAPPAIAGVLKDMMQKGDKPIPAVQKKGTGVSKPIETTKPKAAAPKTLETFASF